MTDQRTDRTTDRRPAHFLMHASKNYMYINTAHQTRHVRPNDTETARESVAKRSTHSFPIFLLSPSLLFPSQNLTRQRFKRIPDREVESDICVGEDLSIFGGTAFFDGNPAEIHVAYVRKIEALRAGSNETKLNKMDEFNSWSKTSFPRARERANERNGARAERMSVEQANE